MHKGHIKIYENALNRIDESYQNRCSVLYELLTTMLQESSENEKIKILGEEIYVDYLTYKKRLNEEKFQSFISLFNTIFSGHDYKTKKEKEKFLKSYMGLGNQFKEKLSLAKIVEDYFSINIDTYINYKKII